MFNNFERNQLTNFLLKVNLHVTLCLHFCKKICFHCLNLQLYQLHFLNRPFQKSIIIGDAYIMIHVKFQPNRISTFCISVQPTYKNGKLHKFAFVIHILKSRSF